MLSILNWNIDENRIWFIRLADSGAAVSVELYLTLADAQAQTNLQASGESSGYGSDLEVILGNDSEATTPVSFFQEEYLWHLVVSGQNGDPVKIFKIKEFVEMDEISHAIYRNSTLIGSRAAAEIDAHTHAVIIRNISPGLHLPELEVGDIARLNSARRSVDDFSQVVEHEIVGEINDDGTQSLVSNIETRKYLELKR